MDDGWRLDESIQLKFRYKLKRREYIIQRLIGIVNRNEFVVLKCKKPLIHSSGARSVAKTTQAVLPEDVYVDANGVLICWQEHFGAAIHPSYKSIRLPGRQELPARF